MAETFQNKLTERLQSLLQRSDSRRWLYTGLTTGLIGLSGLAWLARQKIDLPASLRIASASETDPGLIKKGTKYECYETRSGIVYPRIRTFYNEHAQAKKLPADMPLLVFMHGLGGSVAQFAPLLTMLTQIAPCLAIDLPGCGLSDFQPHSNEAYTTTAFAELLYAVIDRYRNKEVNQKVVLVGHSMGCSISALLASSSSPLAHLGSDLILGMVAICPRSTALSEKDLLGIERLNYIPSPIFDLMRMFDRRGGADSHSVSRVVGGGADLETKKLQLRFNQQSKSKVFQKITMALREQEKLAAAIGEESLLGRRVWNGVKVPLFLVAAENDTLAPPREVEQIVAWLTSNRNELPLEENASLDSKADNPQWQPEFSLAGKAHSPTSPDMCGMPSIAGDVANTTEQLARIKTKNLESEPPGATTVKEEEAASKHSFALKTTMFPAPASHGLLYATADVRILSGLIENFLAKHVDQRLSPGWQLQHLTTSGKWDVKNLKKWQSIAPCSDPIAGIFRAMKTMREIDEVHTPKEFVKRYSWKAIPDGVAMVVDISHDAPVYDKNGLEAGDVEYYKFPTVSKLPPAADEVEQFIGVIDGLRRSPKIEQVEEGKPHPTIGVHCHYGFNRTGFFLVCYLVERLGWRLQDAIEEFAQKRAPGIKHEYFVNELYVRYAVKMERRGTVVG